MDRGAWWATVQRVAESDTTEVTEHAHTHTLPINGVVAVSGGQQRNSAGHIHVSILPQTPLPCRVLCNVEQSSLCYTVGPCQLSLLYIAVCTCPSQIDIYCEMICHNEFSISHHWALVLHPKVTKLFFHKIFMGIQFHLKILLRLNILTFNFICS